MLYHHPDLNPSVRAAAELATDGVVTDAILHDAAIMAALPLFVVRLATTGPCAVTLAQRAVAAAEAGVRQAHTSLDGARRRLGLANRRTDPPLWKGGQPRPIPPARVRAAQSDAMRFLNSRRVLVRRMERELAAARAALSALAS